MRRRDGEMVDTYCEMIELRAKEWGEEARDGQKKKGCDEDAR